MLGATLVESLAMREDANLLVAKFVLAHFAHHVISDDQVGLLKFIALCGRVNPLNICQSLANLLVLLHCLGVARAGPQKITFC